MAFHLLAEDARKPRFGLFYIGRDVSAGYLGTLEAIHQQHGDTHRIQRPLKKLRKSLGSERHTDAGWAAVHVRSVLRDRRASHTGKAPLGLAPFP